MASDLRNKCGTMFPSRALLPVRHAAVRSPGNYKKVVTTELASAVMSDARTVGINIYEKMLCKRL
jgi:hypothetical protein